MAYEEVSRVEVTEIVRRWQAGESTRGLARATGLSRNTVKKYVAAAEGCGLTRGGSPPTESELLPLVQLNVAGRRPATIPTEILLSPWAEQIRVWLKDERLRLTRIQELLRGRQLNVAYTSLRRFIAKRGWGKNSHVTVRLADTPPGEVAEMDFGRLGMVWDPDSGRRRLVWALVVVLAYSRHCFVWPLFRQQLADVIEGLEAGWAFFGGMPRYLVIDNFPAAVAGADPLSPRLTRGFLEYAQRRGLFADPARPRHPKDKPKVESGVNFVKQRFFKGGDFHGLADLRVQAKRWCLETAGQRVHGTTQRLPLVVFQEEEQAKLLPWDGEPYEVPDWKRVTVHPDHHIAYRYALYSAPSTTCPPGTEIEVRGDSKLVRLYRRGVLAKVHPRQPRGGRSTDPADYPVELTAYSLRSPNYMRRQLAELGEDVGAFAERLLGGPTPWSRLRQAQKMLRLGERYTSARLNAACRRALAVDLIDVRRLERILIEALEEEAVLATSMASMPPGRFARSGAVFAVAARRKEGVI
ncbi:MAG: IS21 family transposase [Chloroflexota bacterium]|nr:IS21 family transposase [Dehalococcoidia bacterium]